MLGHDPDKPGHADGIGLAAAIGRETRFKHRPRAWKVSLIPAANPSWADLYDRFI
jgi:predicted GIY-YIG superfamily endonuclease